MDEDTRMQEPHDEVSIPIIITCVSLELLDDGPYAVKGKVSFSMRWTTLPWMSIVRPCTKKKGPLIVVELVGDVCDLMVEGENARDKGGT